MIGRDGLIGNIINSSWINQSWIDRSIGWVIVGRGLRCRVGGLGGGGESRRGGGGREWAHLHKAAALIRELCNPTGIWMNKESVPHWAGFVGVRSAGGFRFGNSSLPALNFHSSANSYCVSIRISSINFDGNDRADQTIFERMWYWIGRIILFWLEIWKNWIRKLRTDVQWKPETSGESKGSWFG